MSKKSSNLTRRAFLKHAALLAAAPSLIPASALGRDGKVPPSSRIIVGGIGIGGRGTHDLRCMLPERDVQFVGICDARKDRRKAVKKMVDTRYGNKDCAMYRDIREFLAVRTDIDAVLIATGDRWHALAAILAMRAGKDVYSEKPSSMTIAEGQAVVETARRYRRIYQTGIQRLSEANFIFANELVRTGRLGKVHTVRAHMWTFGPLSHDWLPAQPLRPKDEMDWDAWLGPCPWRPYNSSYLGGLGGWGPYYDLSTGCIGGWGAHTFAQCQAAINAADTSPVEYKYVNSPCGDGMVTRFASGIKMILQREGWRGSCGVRYEGTEGWVSVADGYEKPEASPPSLLAELDKIVNAYKARTGRPTSQLGGLSAMGHMRDLLDCVKSRRQTVANPVVMHRSMSTVHAANICMWLKRDMRYDPVKEEFVNDPEANRLRSRAMREPWII